MVTVRNVWVYLLYNNIVLVMPSAPLALIIWSYQILGLHVGIFGAPTQVNGQQQISPMNACLIYLEAVIRMDLLDAQVLSWLPRTCRRCQRSSIAYSCPTRGHLNR